MKKSTSKYPAEKLASGQYLLPLRAVGNDLLIDSRVIADALSIRHESMMAGIYKYRNDIEKMFGGIRFEIGVPDKPTGNPPKFACLTEDQAIYIGTLSRNTEKVVEFKARLVKTFSEARKQLQSSRIPQTLPEALRAYAAELEQKEALQKQLKEQAPKVALADACLTAKNSQTITQTAKVLGIGRNILCEFLRHEKIFYRHRGENVPCQYFIDAGYFVVKERSIDHYDRFENHTQPLVTPKGLQFLERKIRETGGIKEIRKIISNSK
jgi:anti-repressor protein